jgi:hypothetical protein
VFDAWLDPDGRRVPVRDAGRRDDQAEVDARVGGRFNFTDRRPDMGDVDTSANTR